MRKTIWPKGLLLGTLIFFLTLFYAAYQRSRHGLSTGFSDMLSIWQVLAAYLVVCLVAGCLLYLIVCFVLKIWRRGWDSNPR